MCSAARSKNSVTASNGFGSASLRPGGSPGVPPATPVAVCSPCTRGAILRLCGGASRVSWGGMTGRDVTRRSAPRPAGVATPSAPYSPVIVSGDLVAPAGQVAFDAQGQVVPGGIREPARQALAHLERCLAAAGAGLAEGL